MGCDGNYGLWLSYKVGISIHAARMGCDGGPAMIHDRGAISIHAARMGCDRRVTGGKKMTTISIHAARMGCDQLRDRILNREQEISIHAARMGCDNRQKIS